MAKSKRGFFGRLIDNYVKPWFFSSDDPTRIKAPYVISFIFLGLTIAAIIIHLMIKLWQFDRIKELWTKYNKESLADIIEIAKLEISLVPLITVLVGTAGLFIGLYNWGKTKRKPSAQCDTVDYQGTGNDDGTISENEI